MINTLYLIRGLPGSGKSTYAKNLLNSITSPTILLEADMYHYINNIYNFDPSRLADAHDWCRTNTNIFLNNGHNVIVANTFVSHVEIDPYIEIANNLKIPYKIFKCTGEFKSIHNVPEHIIENMKKRWQPIDGEDCIIYK